MLSSLLNCNNQGSIL